MGADSLLTKGEVAARLRCSQRTVERLVANGDLPVVPVGDLRRFRNEAVDEYIKAHEMQVSHIETRLNAVLLTPVPAN